MAGNPIREFHSSIEDSDIERVRSLLDSGVANANMVDPTTGTTPLGIAIASRDHAIAQLLVERGANLNPDGVDPPLIGAVLGADIEMIRLLIRGGADPNRPSQSGSPPIFYAVLPEVIAELRAGGANLNVQNAKGDTPLTLNLQRRVTPVTKNTLNALLEQGADPNLPDRGGTEPLWYTMDPEIVLALIRKGANPNLVHNGEHYIFSIIEFYISYYENGRQVSVFFNLFKEMLAKGVDPNVRDSEGAPVVHYAAAYLNKLPGIQLARIFVKAGADPNAEDNIGMTALEKAMYFGIRGITLVEAIELGFNPNFLNRKGNAILHRIADRTDRTPAELAKVMSNASTIPGIQKDIRNRNGETALHIAARRNNAPLVEVLMEMKLDPNDRVESDGGDGPTAFDLATDENVKNILRGYRGKTRSVIEFFQQVFEDPTNVSVCPICLAYTVRTDGCRYMTHVCKPTERMEALYQKFRGRDPPYKDKIEWCTECGRICDNHHRHYELATSGTERVGLAAVDPSRQPQAMGAIVHYQPDCRPSGGGGLGEKFVRFYAIIQTAARLQTQVGKITEKRARDQTIIEVWNAPLDYRMGDPIHVRFEQLAELLRNPPPAGASPEETAAWNYNVSALKTFDVDLSMFSEDAPAPVPEESAAPDVPRPEADRDLLPIRHDAGTGPVAAGGGGDNYCGPNLGPHEDGRPTFQFRHRRPDGSVYTHPTEDFICGEDLVTLINASSFTGKCPLNTKVCTADLHPDEIDALGDQIPEKFRQEYRSKFNRLKAGTLAVGGSRLKTYRKKNRNSTGRRQKGGDEKSGHEIVKSMFRKMDDDEYLCGVEIGAF